MEEKIIKLQIVSLELNWKVGHGRPRKVQNAYVLLLQRRARNNHRVRRYGQRHLRQRQDLDVGDRQVRHSGRVQDPGGEQVRFGRLTPGIVPGRARLGKAVRDPVLGSLSQAVSQCRKLFHDHDSADQEQLCQV